MRSGKAWPAVSKARRVPKRALPGIAHEIDRRINDASWHPSESEQSEARAACESKPGLMQLPLPLEGTR